MGIRFDVVTLFPRIFDGWLGQSLLKLAIQRGLVGIDLWDLRDWTRDKHRSVDDRPYGGGPGMVIRPEPVFECVESLRRGADPPQTVVLLTPQGERLEQRIVEELAEATRLVLLCGRYEGFDERVHQGLKPREISVGDYICNGGEVPAMVLIDSVIRLVPGVLGHEDSAREDSFSQPGWIEYPQYTRPRVWRDRAVPEVLTSGHHDRIREWRRAQSELITKARRQDLWERYEQTRRARAEP